MLTAGRLGGRTVPDRAETAAVAARRPPGRAQALALLEAENVAVHNDRDRIAQDLHDLVISRLFATGMTLQSVIGLVDERPAEAIVRVHRAVDELDETIRELRSAIYGLQAQVDEPPSVRTRLLRAMDAATAQLGFAPSFRLSGPLDTAVPPGAVEQMLATLSDALGDVARHALASRVDVVVSVQDGGLLLQIEDDGVGLPLDGSRSCRWRVPLP